MKAFSCIGRSKKLNNIEISKKVTKNLGLAKEFQSKYLAEIGSDFQYSCVERSYIPQYYKCLKRRRNVLLRN